MLGGGGLRKQPRVLRLVGRGEKEGGRRRREEERAERADMLENVVGAFRWGRRDWSQD